MDDQNAPPDVRTNGSVTIKQVYDLLRSDMKQLDQQRQYLDERAADTQRHNDALERRVAEVVSAEKQLLLREQAVAEREEAVSAKDEAFQDLQAQYSDLVHRYSRIKKETRASQLTEALTSLVGLGGDSGEDGDIDTAEEASVYATPPEVGAAQHSRVDGAVSANGNDMNFTATIQDHRAKLAQMERDNNALSIPGSDVRKQSASQKIVVRPSGSKPGHSRSLPGIEPRQKCARESVSNVATNIANDSNRSITPTTTKPRATSSAKPHASDDFGNIKIGFSTPADLGSCSIAHQVSLRPTFVQKIKLLKRYPTEDELQGRDIARGEQALKPSLQKVYEVRQDVKSDANIFRCAPSRGNSPNPPAFRTAHVTSSSPSLKVITGKGSGDGPSPTSTGKVGLSASFRGSRTGTIVGEGGSPLQRGTRDSLRSGSRTTSSTSAAKNNPRDDSGKQSKNYLGLDKTATSNTQSQKDVAPTRPLASGFSSKMASPQQVPASRLDKTDSALHPAPQMTCPTDDTSSRARPPFPDSLPGSDFNQYRSSREDESSGSPKTPERNGRAYSGESKCSSRWSTGSEFGGAFI